MTSAATLFADDGPLHRHKIGGSLFYDHPRTGERFISVTSVNDKMSKDFLDNRWKPGQAALAAYAELPRVVALSRTKPCGRTNSRCDHDWNVTCDNCPCGNCKACMIKWLTNAHYRESSRRAAEGTGLHKYIKYWVESNGKQMQVPDEVQPYIAQFHQFVEDFGLTPDSWEMCEATILNRSARWSDQIAGWGGTLDAHIRFDATATKKALALCKKFGLREPLVTLDWKSRENDKPAFYPENAKQLAPYCRGEVILFDDGREVELPKTDGGVVVQIRPNGYAWRRADTSDSAYEAFLNTMRAALWDIFHGEAATQVQTFPDLDIPDLPMPEPKKRAPRKATAATRNRIKAPAGAAETTDPAARADAIDRVHALIGGRRQPHPDSPYNDEVPF